MTEQEQISLLQMSFKDGGWIKVPKKFIQEVGAVPAIVLWYMVDKVIYFKKTTIWFDNIDLAAKLCGLPSRHIFNKAIEKLESHNFVKSELKGVPPRKNYTLDAHKLITEFSKPLQTDFENNDNLILKNIENQFSTDLQIDLEKNDKISNNTTNNKPSRNKPSRISIEDKSSSPNHWKEFDEFIGGPFFSQYPKRGRRDVMFKSLVAMQEERKDIDSVEKVRAYLEQFKKGLKIYLNSVDNPKFILAPQSFISSRMWEQNNQADTDVSVKSLSKEEYLKNQNK